MAPRGTKAKSSSRAPMSAQHKQALAEGRDRPLAQIIDEALTR